MEVTHYTQNVLTLFSKLFYLIHIDMNCKISISFTIIRILRQLFGGKPQNVFILELET